MAWTPLCSVAELPPVGKTRLCEVAGKGGAVVKVALARTESGLYALDDHCPHRAGPMSEGWIESACPPAPPGLSLASPTCHAGEETFETLTCPWHQWAFDLRTGVCQNIPGQQIRAWKVVEKEGVVGIDF